MRARIPLQRGVELESVLGFYIGVAPSWHPDADFTSAWRPARMRAQSRRGAELASGRGFHFGVASSWNPTRILLRRGDELTS